MGASASGNSARFDSDCGHGTPSPPTKRLASALFDSEDSHLSFGSNSASIPSTSTSTSASIAARSANVRRHFQSFERSNDDIFDNIDDDNTEVNQAPKRKGNGRSKSVNANSSESSSTATPPKNIRDVRADTVVKLNDYLVKNKENSELHKDLIQKQIDRE